MRGRFYWPSAPSGTVTLRVRRVGYTPTIVTVNVTEGGTDTVRVVLRPVPYKLAAVRSTDDACPGRPVRLRDSAIVTILEQIQTNAERYSLLADEFPFESRMERTIADDMGRSVGSRSYRRVRHVDTVTAAAIGTWRYQPGRLVARERDVELGVYGALLVPRLTDFADSVFLAAHCFRYVGVQSRDGRRVARVNFEPIKSLREPDVSGFLLLDPASYQILQSNMRFEVPSPATPGDIWVVSVDTWFLEALPGIPVVERICQRTTLRDESAGAPGNAAVEAQQLVDLVFLNARPDAEARAIPPATRCP
jgi:hypothetical protein